MRASMASFGTDSLVYPTSDFLKPGVVLVLLPAMIGCLAVDILGMRRQTAPDRRREVGIASIRHILLLALT
jgi:hypothetical protein